jgi:Tol biopolymer transport system component
MVDEIGPTQVARAPVDKWGMRYRRRLAAAALAVAILCIAWLPTSAQQSRIPLTATLRSGSLAISPDGQHLAYLEIDEKGRQDLWLKNLRSGTRNRLQTADRASPLRYLSFSPDGRSLLFYAWKDKTLRRLAVSGGRSTTICKVDNLTAADWGDDDQIVFVQHAGWPAGEIRRVSATGGASRLVAPLEEHENVTDLQVLPGSRAVLFSVTRNSAIEEVVAQPLNGGSRHVVIERGGDARYVRSTRQIAYRFSDTPFGLGPELWIASFDPVVLRTTTVGVRAAEGVPAGFVISSSGTLAYAAEPMELVRLFRDGRRMPLGTLHQHTSSPRVSPDGRRVAFIRNGLWVADLDNVTSTMRRLTLGALDASPVWSRDSQRIAFGRTTYPRHGKGLTFEDVLDDRVDTILSVSIDGARQAETTVSHSAKPEFWLATSGRLAYQRNIPGLGASLWTTFPGGATSRLVLQGNDDLHSALSPDGKWLAFEWTREGLEPDPVRQVYVSPYRSGGTPTLVTEGEAHTPLWSRDGTELFIENGQRILVTRMQIDLARKVPTFSAPVALPIVIAERTPPSGYGSRKYDLMPDGASFLMLRRAQPELVVIPNALNGRTR